MSFHGRSFSFVDLYFSEPIISTNESATGPPGKKSHHSEFLNGSFTGGLWVIDWKLQIPGYDKEHTICTVTATNDPSFETVRAWNFFIFKYSILLHKSPKHI